MKNKTILGILIPIIIFSACNDKDIFSTKKPISPKIIYTHPGTDLLNDLKINSSILISFDIEMDQATFTKENIILKNEKNQKIPCSFEFYGKKTVIIYPSVTTKNTETKVSFSSNTEYNLCISKRIKDCNSIPLEKDYKLIFKTSIYEDSTEPEILEDRISIKENLIKIYFNEPLDPQTIKSNDSSRITLVDNNDNNIKYNCYSITAENAIFLEPESDFRKNITYTLTFMKNSISDMANNFLSKKYAFTFKNKILEENGKNEEEDITPPAIAKVSSSLAIIIEFTEDINSSTTSLTGSTPTIIADLVYTPDNGETLFRPSNYDVTFSNGTKSIYLVPDIFTPVPDFKPSYLGTLRIKPGIKDLAGNSLEKEQFYCFGDYTVSSDVDLAYLSDCYGIANGNLIINSHELKELAGLENLTQIEGTLNITGNPVLENLDALNNLKNADKAIYITENNSLKCLKGLSRITETMELNIIKNQKLLNLSGLDSITSVQDINIEDNPVLNSTNALNNLTTINNLYIVNNENLISMNFNSIKSLDDLKIENNINLTEIHFNELKSLKNVTIKNNSSLSKTKIDDFINRIKPSGNIIISGNLE